MTVATKSTEWFGADVERSSTKGGQSSVEVRFPEDEKRLRVRTVAKNPDVAEATARYKAMKQGLKFAPDKDKPLWEARVQLAYYEMQSVRFDEASSIQKDPLQKKHLAEKARFFRFSAQELIAQGVK